MGQARPVRGASRIYPGEYGAEGEIEIRPVFELESPDASNQRSDATAMPAQGARFE